MESVNVNPLDVVRSKLRQTENGRWLKSNVNIKKTGSVIITTGHNFLGVLKVEPIVVRLTFDVSLFRFHISRFTFDVIRLV